MFAPRTITLFLFSLILTIASAEVLSAAEMKFLFFGSARCPNCAQVKPRVDAFLEKGWPITYVDAEHDLQAAGQFQIRDIPTFIMLIDGKEVERFVGGPDPDAMQEKIINLYTKGQKIVQQAGAGAMPASVAPVNNQVPPNAQAVLPPQENGQRNSYISASVRIRANDPTGLSTGTGTIIDTREGEALVLTCAHIFRESQGRGAVDLELFLDNGIVKVQGECVDFDLENDIAFVKFAVPHNAAILAIPLASRDTLQNGQTLISVGCDSGANPSIRQHRIISLDKCSTPPNYRNPFHYIQVSGAPTQGRSGGGLFSVDGHLVGVCNTGDSNSNDGHFVPLSVVRGQLDKLGFSVVYQSPSLGSQPTGGVTPSPSNIALASTVGPTIDNPLRGAAAQTPLSDVSQSQNSSATSFQSLTPEERATIEEVRRRQAEGAEVILIINPPKKGNEKPQSDIIKLENVSEKFLDVLLEKNSTKTSDSRTRHPSLTEQAAALNQRSIAAPSGGQQRETGLRTQIKKTQ